MDGNNNSSTHLIDEKTDTRLDDELQKLNNFLDDFEIKCGFPATVNENTKNRATELLNLDFTNFKMSSDECAEAAACLSQYALNLSRVINKERSVVKWAIEKSKKLYNYHNTVEKLTYIRVRSELLLSRIETLYFNVKDIASRFDNLSRALRGIR